MCQWGTPAYPQILPDSGSLLDTLIPWKHSKWKIQAGSNGQETSSTTGSCEIGGVGGTAGDV